MGWPSTPDAPIQDKLFDSWTLGHLAIGAICSKMGFDWKSALILAVGWEFVENVYIMPRTHWHDETFQNAVGDIIGNMAGFWLASKF